MRKLLMAAMLLILTLSVCCASTRFEYYPQNIRVYSLLKEPIPDSEAAFVFPIEVSLTGISKDKKWYRFKVYYDLVFLGKYEFEGWAQVDPWKPFTENATPETIDIE